MRCKKIDVVAVHSFEAPEDTGILFIYFFGGGMMAEITYGLNIWKKN